MTMFPTFLINFLITLYFLLDAPQNANGVKLADTQAPIVNCPDNIVTTNNRVTLPQCTGFNNGGIGYVFFRQNIDLRADTVYSSEETFPTATTTNVTCRARDSAGNDGTCTFAVTVNSKCTILNCVETFLSVFEMSK